MFVCADGNSFDAEMNVACEDYPSEAYINEWAMDINTSSEVIFMSLKKMKEYHSKSEYKRYVKSSVKL